LIFFLESTNNLEAIKQSYMNTVNELNQELLAMKEAYDQLDTEKQDLITEFEKRLAQFDQDQETRTAGMLSSFNTPLKCCLSCLLGKTTPNIVQNPFEKV
jgi:hypothetical protein